MFLMQRYGKKGKWAGQKIKGKKEESLFTFYYRTSDFTIGTSDGIAGNGGERWTSYPR
jgi:hypothetical protein